MIIKETLLQLIRKDIEDSFIEPRLAVRLIAFLPYEDAKEFLKEEVTEDIFKQEEFTEENVLNCLKRDLEFAFEKALDKRGISASLMYEVILGWMKVLEDDLRHHSVYAHYGLPLYKAVAIKYGFENPIGDDTGSEYMYSAEYEYCDDGE